MGLPDVEALLAPENGNILRTVLQYHIVPGAPLVPSSLRVSL